MKPIRTDLPVYPSRWYRPSEYHESCAHTPIWASASRAATSSAATPSTLTRNVGTRPSIPGRP